MLHSPVVLVTSNQSKIAEFKRFGLDFEIVSGNDVKEVNGTIDEVIIYKALESSNRRIVEDTVLLVDGIEIVDIRYKIHSLKEQSRQSIMWVVSLGIRDRGYIYVYRGSVPCLLHNDGVVHEDAFGFDALLRPINSQLSFYELEHLGIKDKYSPRKIAVQNMLAGKYCLKVKESDVAEWTGGYQ